MQITILLFKSIGVSFIFLRNYRFYFFQADVFCILFRVVTFIVTVVRRIRIMRCLLFGCMADLILVTEDPVHVIVPPGVTGDNYRRKIS